VLARGSENCTKKGKHCCLAHKVLISSIIFLLAFVNMISVILPTKNYFSTACGLGNTGHFHKTVLGKKLTQFVPKLHEKGKLLTKFNDPHRFFIK
jgi:hypothetical protein